MPNLTLENNNTTIETTTTIKGTIIPNTDVSYDIGSPTNQINCIYTKNIVISDFEYSAGKITNNFTVPHNTNTNITFLHHVGHNNWSSGVYTIQNTGDFKITASIGFAGSSNDDIYKAYMAITRNGTQIFSTSYTVALSASEDDYNNGSLCFNTIENLNANDNIGLLVNTLTSSGNGILLLPAQTRFTLERLIG